MDPFWKQRRSRLNKFEETPGLMLFALLHVGLLVLFMNLESAYSQPSQSDQMKSTIKTEHSTNSKLSSNRFAGDVQIKGIMAKKASCFFSEMSNGSIYGAILGNELRIYKSQSTCEALTIASKQWQEYCEKMTYAVWKQFGTLKTESGQAVFTLVLYPDKSLTVATKTIYLPGCRPYTGSGPMDLRVSTFWRQIETALHTVDYKDFPKVGEVKSITLEMCLGRDKEVFPRYKACGQFQTVSVDDTGQVRVPEGKILRTEVLDVFPVLQ